jgi:hypothetical protein
MFHRLPHAPVGFGTAVVALIVTSVVVAACAGGGTTPAPGASQAAAASGTAACRSAPQPGNLPDWKAPATPPAIYPLILANPGELTCGKNRVIFTFVDAGNNVLSKPTRTASIAVFNLGRDPRQAVATAQGTFIWAIHDVNRPETSRGIYVTTINFPEAGTYGAEFTTADSGTGQQVIRATFTVDASSPTIAVGQKAPSTKTQAAADGGGDLARISTDSSPDPALYRISEDAALAKHDPFVMIFATPKFCRSSQCGPTLDRIKPFVAKYPTIDFIHVEPYKLDLQNGELQAVLDAQGNLISNSVTDAWGLTGEPWVFVVDRTGTVTASLELIFSDAELTAALDAVK